MCYEQKHCLGSKICNFFSATPAISYKLSLAVLPNLSNCQFGLHFDSVELIQSSRCCWCWKKRDYLALNFDFDILTFFFVLSNAGVSQCMDSHLVSTWYSDIQVSLQVMMFSINSSPPSNPSRKLSTSVDKRAFGQGSNSLLPTSHRLCSCSIRHVNFFWQFLYQCLPFQ